MYSNCDRKTLKFHCTDIFFVFFSFEAFLSVLLTHRAEHVKEKIHLTFRKNVQVDKMNSIPHLKKEKLVLEN